MIDLQQFVARQTRRLLLGLFVGICMIVATALISAGTARIFLWRPPRRAWSDLLRDSACSPAPARQSVPRSASVAMSSAAAPSDGLRAAHDRFSGAPARCARAAPSASWRTVVPDPTVSWRNCIRCSAGGGASASLVRPGRARARSPRGSQCIIAQRATRWGSSLSIQRRLSPAERCSATGFAWKASR